MSNKERRAYKTFSDQEIRDYVAKNYLGFSIKELSIKEYTLSRTIRERRLTDKLVDEGLLIRKLKKAGTYSSLDKKKARALVYERFNGERIWVLRSNDACLYNRLLELGLVDDLVQRGILQRSCINGKETVRKGFYSEMLDKELVNYVTRFHKGKSLSVLAREVNTLYGHILKRGLIEELVKRKILSRKIRKTSSLREEKYIIQEIMHFMEEWDLSNLPSALFLANHHESGLGGAITRFHGGFTKFRETFERYVREQNNGERTQSLLEAWVNE